MQYETTSMTHVVLNKGKILKQHARLYGGRLVVAKQLSILVGQVLLSNYY
jgi:hypothetical protein